MNFLNPLVLIGLIAAGIPILLHFLNLRKMKKVEFSTLRFLKELQKTKIRHLKIKRLLLLILRTLLIIFIVLAFARPIIEGTLPILETYANSSTVIIIDNSFSMDVSDEYGNRFNHSKLAAREILRQIGEGDEVTVLPMAGDFAAGMSDLTRNHALVSETLEQIDISNSEADLEKSLQMASLLLDNAANINREIFIISDAQANIFPEKENRGAFPYPVNIYFMNLSARSGSEIKNLAVDSLNVISRIFQPGKPVETEAYIRNSSSNPVEDVVVSMAFNGKRVTQRAIDLNANALSTIPISFAPTERGSYKGALEIEGDALDIDNKRYFGFTIPKSPEILLAGSDASIRFIRLAVKEFNRDSDFANARIVDPGQFSAFNLENYEMVLLAGGDFRESDYMKVRNYVNNGGSAMIFGGEEDSNELFSALKALGFGAISITSYDEANPMRFSSIDRQHPVFEGVFSGETDNKKIIESPDIY
ncbi:MAG: vWA domain-containing protein, partial [Bacteroidota bacterium]